MRDADDARSRGSFLVLLALSDGPKHGYEVSSWIAQRSAGFFSLSFGALYPLLHRLERDGLVAGRWSEGPGKRKKIYTLTSAGKRSLLGERKRHREMTHAWDRLLGAEG